MSMRRALVLSVSGRYLSTLVQIAGSLVVARLLTPTDFGLFGIAASVIAVTSSLREFGVTNYLVQLRDLDRTALGRAMAFTMTLSLGIGVPLVLARAPIARFFGEPRVADLIGILSINFLLVPLSIGTVAKLQHQMRFGILQAINIIGAATSILTTIVLALSGFGPVSLALGQVAQSLILVAILAWIDPPTVFPRPVFTGLGPMVRFGSFSALSYLFYQSGTYGTSIILGRTLGPAAVGFFDRGHGLVQTISNDLLGSICQVVYVGLSRARDDAAAFAALFLRSLANLTAALFAVFALLAALAHPTIMVLFGGQWEPAVPVLQVLCISGVISAAAALFTRLMLSFGRTDRLFYIDVAGQSLRLLAVLALARFGPTAAAWGAVAASLFMMAMFVGASRRYLHARRREIVMVWVNSAAIAVVTALPAMALVELDPFDGRALPTLIVGGMAGGLTWLAAVFGFRHSLAGEIRNLLSHLRSHLAVRLGRPG